MNLRRSLASLLVFSLGVSSLPAQDKWPENVAGAWLVLRAESFEDGESDGTDPAAHGNLLLLIDNILVLACDKNVANDRRFSEAPELIDSGVQFVATGEKENVLLAKHASLGHCSITATHLAGELSSQLTLKTVYHNTKFPRLSNNLRVERLNQDAARKRVQAMLDSGEIRSSADIAQRINSWLQMAGKEDASGAPKRS